MQTNAIVAYDVSHVTKDIGNKLFSFLPDAHNNEPLHYHHSFVVSHMP